MTATPRIVVGVDGSDAAAFALDWAMDRAARIGAEVELVHAWFPPTIVSPEAFPVRADAGTLELQAKHLLEGAAEDVLARVGQTPVRVHTTLVRRDPTRALEKASLGAAQVVVGTHGMGFVGRALLGSVAERIIDRSQAPVTVVPHADRLPIGDGRVVVGVDGSRGSHAALRYAVAEAGAHDAALTVVFAYSPIPHGSVVPAEMGDYGRAMVTGMLDSLGSYATGRLHGLEVLAVAGRPAATLLGVAEGASELVVGYSGHDTRPRTFGSVGRRCVHHASCPVTIVKPAPLPE